jgi:hypothetical protein
LLVARDEQGLAAHPNAVGPSPPIATCLGGLDRHVLIGVVRVAGLGRLPADSVGTPRPGAFGHTAVKSEERVGSRALPVGNALVSASFAPRRWSPVIRASRRRQGPAQQDAASLAKERPPSSCHSSLLRFLQSTGQTETQSRAECQHTRRWVGKGFFHRGVERPAPAARRRVGRHRRLDDAAEPVITAKLCLVSRRSCSCWARLSCWPAVAARRFA